jgi:hypothetical protein
MPASPDVDHLIFAVPDLEAGITLLEERLGVRAAPGGKHPGGTHNALLSLGGNAYLEVLAPDPEHGSSISSLAQALTSAEPRLFSWAARAEDIESRVEAAAAAGFPIGDISALSRDLPGGAVLHWRFTFPPPPEGAGVVPFLISWGESPHPSETAPGGCELVSLRGEHPDVDTVRRFLAAMHVDLPVRTGPVPAIIATIRCPKGAVELR